MTDLTRLMFDDGASRAPVRDRLGPVMQWGDTTYEIVVLTGRTIGDYMRGREPREVPARWHYRSGVRTDDDHDVDKFLANPVEWFRQIDGTSPQNQPLPGHPQTLSETLHISDDLCITVFEKIS